MFTHSFHSILHAERSAHYFERRNKPTHTQIAIIRRFWRRLIVISFPFEIFRGFDAIFTALCVQNVVHKISIVETSPGHTQIAIIRRIWRRLVVISIPPEIVSMFTLSFHSILHAERSAYDFHRRNKPTHTQIVIIRRFWGRLIVISIPFEIFPRLHSLFTPFYMQNVMHMISRVETSPETRKSQSFVDFDDN